LLALYPAEERTCWPVSARVGNVKNNDPSLIEPIGLRSMNLHRRLAAVVLMLTLVGCVQGPQSQGQAPYAPYSLDSNGNVHDRGGDGGSGGDM
jgi:hypothetical protein